MAHVPSHVNRETPFDSAVSTVLAAGGGVLVSSSVRWPRPRSAPGRAQHAACAARRIVTLMIGSRPGVAMIVRGVVEVNAGHQQAALRRGRFSQSRSTREPAWRAGAAALAWRCRGPAGTRPRAPASSRSASPAYGLAIIAALPTRWPEVHRRTGIVVAVCRNLLTVTNTSRDGGQCTVDLLQAEVQTMSVGTGPAPET